MLKIKKNFTSLFEKKSFVSCQYIIINKYFFLIINIMSEEIKPNIYPDSPLGENNIITNIKNSVEESPLITYSAELLNDVVSNTNKKITDKEINIIDDFTAIFPLSVTLVLLIVILIFIYVSFF